MIYRRPGNTAAIRTAPLTINRVPPVRRARLGHVHRAAPVAHCHVSQPISIQFVRHVADPAGHVDLAGRAVLVDPVGLDPVDHSVLAEDRAVLADRAGPADRAAQLVDPAVPLHPVDPPGLAVTAPVEASSACSIS